MQCLSAGKARTEHWPLATYLGVVLCIPRMKSDRLEVELGIEIDSSNDVSV